MLSKYAGALFYLPIAIILIIKVALLLTIKHIWFDAPTIPKNFDNQVAEHIAGDNSSHIKETR
nr:cytochrome oxidase putative small subunit CydP [Acinetobacter baumannii]